MSKDIEEKKDVHIPTPIKILGWFGIIIGAMYLIYGIVSIVLSFLDRTYADFEQNVIILIYGIPIMAVSVGFKNLQKWGWIGYTAVLALIVLLSIFGHKDAYGIVLGVLSMAALVWILTPAVRKHYFPA